MLWRRECQREWSIYGWVFLVGNWENSAWIGGRFKTSHNCRPKRTCKVRKTAERKGNSYIGRFLELWASITLPYECWTAYAVDTVMPWKHSFSFSINFLWALRWTIIMFLSLSFGQFPASWIIDLELKTAFNCNINILTYYFHLFIERSPKKTKSTSNGY